MKLSNIFAVEEEEGRGWMGSFEKKLRNQNAIMQETLNC